MPVRDCIGNRAFQTGTAISHINQDMIAANELVNLRALVNYNWDWPLYLRLTGKSTCQEGTMILFPQVDLYR